MRRRTVLVVTAGAVIVTAAGGGVALTSQRSAAAPVASPTGTATVVRTDLSTTQQVNGTLGYAGNYTVVDLAGTTPAQRVSMQIQLAQAQAQASAGSRAAADARNTAAAQATADQAAVEQATASVAADQRQLTADQDQSARDTARATTDCATTTSPASPACTADQAAVTADNQHVATDQTTLARDQQTLTQAQGKATVDLASGQQAADTAAGQADQAAAQVNAILNSGATTAPTSVSWLPAVGDVIAAGQRLYALEGRPVVLLTGTTPILRTLSAGVPDGPDVAVLKQNLAAFGYPPGPVNQHFDAATAQAVRRWQAALGEPQDGVVRLGDVAVQPTSIRVTSVSGTVGAVPVPGSTVLTGTSTTPDVLIPLSPAKEYLVHLGDAVLVDLPDGTTTTGGHITDISRVATPSQNNNPGTGGAGGIGGNNIQSQQQGQQALATSTVVDVTVTLDDPNHVPALDQAPVQVDITDQSAHGVLAVPVNALLALADGGYGVEERTPHGDQTVRVQVGLFGNNLVQVSGNGITPGAMVEVPAS